jgi:FG-GAP-like repeat
VVVTIASAPTARTEVLLGNGDGTFQAPLAVTSACCVTALAVADFNRDGKPDVAVLLRSLEGVSSDRLLIYLGTGAGTFAAPLATVAGAYPSALVVGEFNRDGRPDVVVANQGDLSTVARAGSGFSILFGKDDGTFSAPVPIPVGIDNPWPVGLVAADWNRDGFGGLSESKPSCPGSEV